MYKFKPEITFSSLLRWIGGYAVIVYALCSIYRKEDQYVQ